MKLERWDRLQELFLQALGLPDGDHDAFVDALGDEDADLVDELRRMLKAHVAAVEWTGPLGKLPGEDELLGTRLGDYRILEPLGRGGSGDVYRAKQLSHDRDVAVKVLRPGMAFTHSGFERFKREALAASRLDHPNLVRVLYFGHDEGRDYLVMELVEGPSLRDQMLHCQALSPDAQPDTLPDLRDPRACAELIRDLARALEHAHDRRLLHRDVKPRNVLLDKHGVPRLTDFGLAKDLELEDLTRTGEVAGTPHYMSPEQARAAKDQIDHRSDIYSLGAVLYELLSGRTPVAGETTAEVIHNILHQPVVPLRRRNTDVPPALALICMQSLRRNPERRYQSAREMADDLERFLANEPVDAERQGLVERTAERLVDRRLLMRLLPVAALLGLVVGGFLYFGAGQVHARMNRPRVEVLVAGGQDARISYLPLDPRHLPAGPEVDLGRATGGRLSPTVVPQGDGRILVRTPSGASAELYREFREGETLTLTAHPREVEPNREGLVRLSADEPLDPPFRPGTLEEVRGAERTVDLPPFAIDEACVTNGDYRRFLAETQTPTPSHWTPTWTQLWNDPPRADWDELPVVNLEFRDALAYAEWRGMRLPTALELEFARGAYESGVSWVEGILAQGAAHPFNLGSPHQGRFGDHRGNSTGGGYVLYVEPSRERPLQPGAQLSHAVGNVSEWTETRALGFPGRGENGARRVKADHWAADFSGEGARAILFCVGIAYDDDSSQDQGFRCARSLPN